MEFDTNQTTTRKVIVIRHAKPEIDRHIQEHLWPLSEIGEEEARQFSLLLKEFSPCRVISSDMKRATQTAKIIAASLDVHPLVWQGLHEHRRTEFKTDEEFMTAIVEFFKRPKELVFGSETAEEARKRITETIEQIGTHYQDNKHIIIISHGTVMTLLAKQFMPEIDEFEFWKTMGTLSRLEFSLTPHMKLEQVVLNKRGGV